MKKGRKGQNLDPLNDHRCPSIHPDPPDIEDLSSWPQLPHSTQDAEAGNDLGGLSSSGDTVRWTSMVKRNPVLSKVHTTPTLKSSSASWQLPNSKTKLGNVENHLFIGGVPPSVSKQHLKVTFARFGKIVDIVIFSRPFRYHSTFGFVCFESSDIVENVLREKEVVISCGPKKGHKLHVEKRKDMRELPFEDLKMTKMWDNLMLRFNWRHVAARYIYRRCTMEDYLANYIIVLAGYLEIKEESINQLMNRLIYLSENRPKDINEIMPPSISGLVYNQAGCHNVNNSSKVSYKSKSSQKHFDVTTILAKHPEWFEISEEDDPKVTYLNTMSKENSTLTLKAILIEGLFVYFFAKFCHGPKFDIKVSYYQRSDPIRSVLLLLTGQRDMSSALTRFFEIFHEVFSYDQSKFLLTLRVDYYRKANKEELKQYLDQNLLLSLSDDEDDDDADMPSVDSKIGNNNTICSNSQEQVVDDVASSSGYESNYSCYPMEIIDLCLAPSASAGAIVLHRIGEEYPDYPYLLQVISEDILDEEDLNLISNPKAIDRILNRMGRVQPWFQPNKSIRQALKIKIEEDIRQHLTERLQEICRDENNNLNEDVHDVHE